MKATELKTQFPSVVSFRLTRKEKQALKRIAASRGDTLSVYWRQVARNHIYINNQKSNTNVNEKNS